MVASVLDDSATERLVQALHDGFGIEPEIATASAVCCGVTNAYAEPGRLGVDRWLALIAANAVSGGIRVVVDCGTAVTVDVLDAEGRHLGGQILPGLGLMHRCLVGNTRVDVSFVSPAGLLGSDTEGCVASGIHHAVAALIDRVGGHSGSDEKAAAVIMTGGDAEAIAVMMNVTTEIRPHLVLEGLALWAGLDIDR